MRGVLRGSLAASVAIGILGAPACALAAVDTEWQRRLTLTAINVVVFAALIYPTHRLVLQPLLRVLQERGSATLGTIERAVELSGDSGRLQEALEERLSEARGAAQARRSEVMAESDAEEQRIVAAAREAAATSVAEVRDSITAELEAARDALESDVRGLAQEAAAKILGRAS